MAEIKDELLQRWHDALASRGHDDACIDGILQQELSIWHVLFDQSRDGIVVINREGKVLAANPAFRDMLGYSHSELLQLKVWDWDAHYDEAAFHEFMKTLSEDGQMLETVHLKRDGTKMEVEIALSCTDFIGEKLVFCVQRDVTQRKANERRIHQMMTTDELTGLLNRREFNQRLEHELNRKDRYANQCALVMLDVDHFKSINDHYGHPTGDQVLVTVSKLIASQVREVDSIARWGGEEFLILLPETDAEQATRVAEKLRIALQAQKLVQVGGVTASFGVTEYRQGDDTDALIKRADAALYEAKSAGRNCVKVSAF